MSDWLDEDGYPTEAALEKVATWEYDAARGWEPLIDFARELWMYPEYFSAPLPRKGLLEQPVTKYRISTGGWSGNESVIDALEGNFMFWAMCWESSTRGGHYVFELQEPGEPKEGLADA